MGLRKWALVARVRHTSKKQAGRQKRATDSHTHRDAGVFIRLNPQGRSQEKRSHAEEKISRCHH